MRKTTKGLTEFQVNRINNKKQQLKEYLQKNPQIAAVGRVSDWLEDSDYRYPISCTMLSVEDSMENQFGIEYSWAYVSKALRYAAGVVVDLSKLRPKGESVGKGGYASGVTGFVKLYSTINEILRRGGIYKNGAVVANLNISHPDCKDFIGMSASEIPWVKRTLYVSDNPNDDDYLLNSPLLSDIIKGVSNGTLWLAKKRFDTKGNRIFSNVCNGIHIPSRGSCLLSHVNLGLCTLRNLRKAFRNGMRFLCQLHSITGAGRNNYYLSPKNDRQVGLGVIGLANFLAKYKITYADFTDGLESYMNYVETNSEDEAIIFNSKSEKVKKVVITLFRAFEDAATIARKYKMERAFTVEPTASVSYRNKDSRGFVTCPEISPPTCHEETKISTRDSTTFGQEEVQYPLDVETAVSVGHDVYFRLACSWQRLMNSTGLAHSISFNLWNTQEINEGFLAQWLESPLCTTYYRWMIEQSYVDKSTIASTISDSYVGMLLGDADEDFFKPLEGTEDILEESEDTQGFCFITPGNDSNYCEACAG